ncbi:MAG: response regulator [Chitinophagaceae bacterium]|nr:MAG: response regulator [Chitinophagaceae bacterium]
MTHMYTPRYVVLYADDDQDDLDLVLDAFARFTDNVDVITAQDGYEALAYLKNLPPFEPSPCLIILDMNMPRLDGKETLKTIRTMDRFKDVPVVMFTTSSFALDKDFADKHGAGFITKPLDLKQFSAIAEQFISHCADEIKRNIQRKLR